MKLKKIDSKRVNKSHLLHAGSLEAVLGAKVDDFLDIFQAHQHGEVFIVIKKSG